MFLLIALLLKSQPDIGMLAVVTAVFFAQLYVAGLNLAFVGFGILGLVRRGGRRLHRCSRTCRAACSASSIPAAGDHYQVDDGLEAFGNGGLLGRGPGEGQ